MMPLMNSQAVLPSAVVWTRTLAVASLLALIVLGLAWVPDLQALGAWDQAERSWRQA